MGKDVSTFQIFFVFLGLGFSQEFIASDQEQGNKISMTSSATIGLTKRGPPVSIANVGASAKVSTSLVAVLRYSENG